MKAINRAMCFIKKAACKRLVQISAFAILTSIAIILMLTSVRTVKIIDGDNIFSVKTFTENISSILSLANLELNEYDTVNYDANGNLIVIRNFPVDVVIGDDRETHYISEGTVGDLLEDNGIIVGKDDKLNYSLDHKLSSGITIEFTNVDYVYSTETEAIPHRVNVIYTSQFKKGQVENHSGTDGEKQVTYLKKIVNGEVVEVKVVGEKTVKNPVAGVKYVGTSFGSGTDMDNWISHLKPAEYIELDANGRPLQYKQLITGIASAYSPDDGRASATGVVLEAGYVAVNPNVIPYGSKLYIKTADGSIIYGYAIAADTGGFIYKYPDRVVDLFMESEVEAQRFGLKNIEIFILE